MFGGGELCTHISTTGVDLRLSVVALGDHPEEGRRFLKFGIEILYLALDTGIIRGRHL